MKTRYLSATDGKFRVIQDGIPLSKDMDTAEDAIAALSAYIDKTPVIDSAWNGNDWVPLTDYIKGE